MLALLRSSAGEEHSVWGELGEGGQEMLRAVFTEAPVKPKLGSSARRKQRKKALKNSQSDMKEN